MDIKQLNEIRKNAGLSIEELSSRANLPKSTVEKILFGIVKHPRIDTIQAIERALGLSETPSSLSDDERALLTLFAEAEEKLGKAYVQGVKQMVRVAIETKS